GQPEVERYFVPVFDLTACRLIGPLHPGPEPADRWADAFRCRRAQLVAQWRAFHPERDNLLDPLSQAFLCALNPFPCRGLADPQLLRSLPLAQTDIVVEQKSLPLVIGQLLERHSHEQALLSAQVLWRSTGKLVIHLRLVGEPIGIFQAV